jgi:molybdate-binding protein/DNA-binding XRE family transcriptional regulator
MGRRTSGLKGNLVREARTVAGFSQADLASQAGIQRQAVNAIEAGRYVPNTLVALKLARALGRSVEDLFPLDEPEETVAQADAAASVRAGDRVSAGRVGDRIVMHRRAGDHAVVEGFSAADGIARSGHAVSLFATREVDETAFIVGCDPSLDMLAQLVTRRARTGRLVWIPGSSRHALDALASSTAHVAGIHLRDARTGECNVQAAATFAEGGALVGYTAWEQGFIVRRGNPKAVTTVEALMQPSVRVINRERGAGSRTLLDQALRDARIPHARVDGYDNVATSHFDVGRAVASGAADAGIGLRAVAASLELDFVPLADIKFDLLIPEQHLHHPVIETLLDALHSASLRASLASLPGYDCSDAGAVRHRFAA